ncbi:MAG: hypothetical protein GY865_17115 [candidate division Zixibacteria bacterium]|nr:hypothetical protein [candidate division Zixibacteria bacterium]
MPRRKIPKKAELIQLQKLYKTDEKIAERLGNVSPQLVAYWRRKKNIPKHSFAKFSVDEIRELWERFGDDYRCGLELGISKAAFYNWRRKYGLKEKPAFLKLEQLELKLGGPQSGLKKISGNDNQTIAQKILANCAGLDKVEIDRSIEIEPDLTVLPKNADQIIESFSQMGLNYVWNPNRIVISLNGIQASLGDFADTNKLIRDFSHRQNLKYFYETGEGCCHQLVVEKGNILPGQLAVCAGLHTASYGCLGALGFDIDKTEMANIWATGKLALKVPKTIKITINGPVPKGVYARDIVLFAAQKLESENKGQNKNSVIEFYGNAVSQMSLSERFTLTNMSSLLGSVTAIVPYDNITRRYISKRTNMPYRPALADQNAIYSESYELNIDKLTPQLSQLGSKNEKIMTSVTEKEGIPVNQVIIGSDTNGRFEDLRVAADIIKGKKINPDVRMYVYPSSRAIYLEALKRGLVRAFMEAGVNVMCPGPVPDMDQTIGSLASGETCLATTGYDFEKDIKPNVTIFQASPATAVATALTGVITNPTGYIK